jgi:carbamoyltransferase
MLVLGISSLHRDSAAALFDANSAVAAIEEEKLSRSSGIGGIPRQAIARCLEWQGARLADVTLAALADRPREAAWREVQFNLRLLFSRPRAADWTRAIGRNFRERTQLRQLRRLLNDAPSLVYFDHHHCHAASAFYTSGFDRSLILTLDEGGGMRSGQISLGENGEIRPIRTLRFPNSLGWFYSRVTELLGLRPRHDEHKVQWLSKDGQPEYLAALRKLFSRDSAGMPVLNQRYFASGPDHRGTFSPQVYRELQIQPGSVPQDAAVCANLARSAQVLLEEIVLEIADRFRAQTSADSLCVAGGVFLNVLLVRALETRSSFRRVHVQPVAGNAGTAIGAAFLARKQVSGNSGQALMSHLALGPGFTPDQTKAVLDNCKIIYKYMPGEDQLIAETAQLLGRGKIVAWCQGRTEFGHRALGNRSILASPFAEYVIENVNQYIKHREDFHPFALSVPAERAAEFFDCTPNCRFMASLGTLRQPLASLERFAFNGRDLRVHIVEQHANPRFWKLLHKSGEMSPAPVLVNTSFNLFGEPLVSDPRAAVRSFYCAGIDALALGNFFVVK